MNDNIDQPPEYHPTRAELAAIWSILAIIVCTIIAIGHWLVSK